ncbi:MAG: TIM barrel protein, partial [Eubacteriales bacterium]|nr:TIM barrel protein [Eubacteriales bacterium]
MIKFGLLTSILDGWSLEETADIAAKMGFSCLEVACWPQGKAERRYAGVSHIDCERVCVDDVYARSVTECLTKRGLVISALAYYPNPMDADPERRAAALSHLRAVICAAQKLKVSMVTTFVGRD